MKTCKVILAGLAVLHLGLPACTPSRESQPQQAAPARQKVDIREIREGLDGKSMREVVRKLGKPDQVFTLGGRESWEYRNIAWDPVTKKTVAFLELTFQNRRVTAINFSY